MTSDPVHRPAHYTSHPSGVECITVTEHMGFNLGNAVKYIWRADLKGDVVQDLEKARWYIDREISRRSATAVQTPVPDESTDSTNGRLVMDGLEWERMVLAIVAGVSSGYRATGNTVAKFLAGSGPSRRNRHEVAVRATAAFGELEALRLVTSIAGVYTLTHAGKAVAAKIPILPKGERYSDSWTERLTCYAAGAVNLSEVEGRIVDVMFDWAHANPTPRYLNAFGLFECGAGETVDEVRDALHHLEDLFVIHVRERHIDNDEAIYILHTWELSGIGEKLARNRKDRA